MNKRTARRLAAATAFGVPGAIGVAGVAHAGATFLTPRANTAVGGKTVTIYAQFTAPRPVVAVKLFLDNTLLAQRAFRPGGTVGNVNFTWDSTMAASGAHRVTLKMYDKAGQVVGMQTIPISVMNGAGPDSVPPQVTIVSPTPNQELRGTFDVKVLATDNSTDSPYVSLFIDKELRSVSNRQPYSVTVDTEQMPNGTHVLEAWAYDAESNKGTATPVPFKVNNIGGATTLNPDITTPAPPPVPEPPEPTAAPLVVGPIAPVAATTTPAVVPAPVVKPARTATRPPAEVTIKQKLDVPDVPVQNVLEAADAAPQPVTGPGAIEELPVEPEPVTADAAAPKPDAPSPLPAVKPVTALQTVPKTTKALVHKPQVARPAVAAPQPAVAKPAAAKPAVKPAAPKPVAVAVAPLAEPAPVSVTAEPIVLKMRGEKVIEASPVPAPPAPAVAAPKPAPAASDVVAPKPVPAAVAPRPVAPKKALVAKALPIEADNPAPAPTHVYAAPRTTAPVAIAHANVAPRKAVVHQKPLQPVIVPELPRDRVENGRVLHAIRPGETAASVARSYGVPMKRLMAANRLGRRSQLRIGQSIAVPSPFRVAFNDEPVQFDVAPRIQDGVTTAALRQMYEAAGGRVEWDSRTREVRATGAGADIVLKIGSRTATVNGRTVDLQTAIGIEHGRTLVPIQFLAHALRLHAEYDLRSGEVSLRKA